MRNLATGALFALNASGTPVEFCTQVMQLSSGNPFLNHCLERCTFWNSSFGQAHCGAAVLTDGPALVACVQKMEGAACPKNGPTAAPVPVTTTSSVTTASETTTSSNTTASETTTSSVTTASETTKATDPVTTAPETTKATDPVTTAPETTKADPATTVTTETQPDTSGHADHTTALPPPEPDHKVGEPGMWYPNDIPVKVDHAAVVGPKGECILPEWDSGAVYLKDQCCTKSNKVYCAKYWADSAQIPGSSEAWLFKADCTGDTVKPWDVTSMSAAVKDKDAWTLFYQPWTPAMPSLEEMEATEAAAVADPRFKLAFDAKRVRTEEEVEAIKPGASTNPENVKRVEKFLKAEDWFKFFPFSHKTYSYENFLKSVGMFPDYCKTYTDGRNSDSICKKLVAASFAHFSQETGSNAPAWTLSMNTAAPENKHPEAAKFYEPNTPIPVWFQGLYFNRESAFQGPDGEKTTTSQYEACAASNFPWNVIYPCSGKHTYFGRGSKQVSWNYNYGMFSEDLFGDATVLLNDPARVADTYLNFASGIWFAVTPQNPKPSMVWALDGTWVPNEADKASGNLPGFGATINIINGGYECNKPSVQAEHRGIAFKALMEHFGEEIPADEPIGCANMRPFPTNSALAMPMYWGKSDPGKYECKLTNTQTPFRVTVPGSYSRCVAWFYRSNWMYQNKLIAKDGEVHNW